MKGEIIIIRQTDETGSIGCCGGIPGKYLISKDDMLSVQLIMDDLTDYYQAIKRKFGERVTIDYVDPRNFLFIGYYLIQHLLKRNISIYHFFKSFINLRRNVIYFNGYLLNQDKKQEEMSIESIVEEINTKLVVPSSYN